MKFSIQRKTWLYVFIPSIEVNGEDLCVHLTAHMTLRTEVQTPVFILQNISVYLRIMLQSGEEKKIPGPTNSTRFFSSVSF